MSDATGQLLLDTLRLIPGDARALRARWMSAATRSRARAIASWAAFEDCELWLRRRLADLDVLNAVPSELREPLQQAARRAAQAHLAIDEEAVRVITLLGDANVPVILIKGQARRAALPKALGDTRRTSDIDLLIPWQHAEAAWRLLRDRSFQAVPVPPWVPPPHREMWGTSRHHLRPLIGPGGVAVELHVSTSWELPPPDAWERLAASAREHGWRGLTVRCPSGTEMLWHALTHAKIGTPEAWRVRFWLDGATAMALEPIDWTVIETRLASPESPGPQSLRWLHAASRVAGRTLPDGLARRPYPLARMLDWRLGVCRPHWGRAVREKLVDEATRSEAHIGVANIAARLGYGLWRAATATRP